MSAPLVADIKDLQFHVKYNCTDFKFIENNVSKTMMWSELICQFA